MRGMPVGANVHWNTVYFDWAVTELKRAANTFERPVAEFATLIEEDCALSLCAASLLLKPAWNAVNHSCPRKLVPARVGELSTHMRR